MTACLGSRLCVWWEAGWDLLGKLVKTSLCFLPFSLNINSILLSLSALRGLDDTAAQRQNTVTTTQTNECSVIIYSPLYCYKPLRFSFFCRTQKLIFWSVCVCVCVWWGLKPENTQNHGDSCHGGDINWGNKSHKIKFFENIKVQKVLWGLNLGVGLV